jgi:hypothetical protein
MVIMKGNFKLKEEGKTISNLDSKMDEDNKLIFKKDVEDKKITAEEFEDFIVKSGAAGSFMIFRSDKKEAEMGIDEL